MYIIILAIIVLFIFFSDTKEHINIDELNKRITSYFRNYNLINKVFNSLIYEKHIYNIKDKRKKLANLSYFAKELYSKISTDTEFSTKQKELHLYLLEKTFDLRTQINSNIILINKKDRIMVKQEMCYNVHGQPFYNIGGVNILDMIKI